MSAKTNPRNGSFFFEHQSKPIQPVSRTPRNTTCAPSFLSRRRSASTTRLVQDIEEALQGSPALREPARLERVHLDDGYCLYHSRRSCRSRPSGQWFDIASEGTDPTGAASRARIFRCISPRWSQATMILDVGDRLFPHEVSRCPDKAGSGQEVDGQGNTDPSAETVKREWIDLLLHICCTVCGCPGPGVIHADAGSPTRGRLLGRGNEAVLIRGEMSKEWKTLPEASR